MIFCDVSTLPILHALWGDLQRATGADLADRTRQRSGQKRSAVVVFWGSQQLPATGSSYGCYGMLIICESYVNHMLMIC